MAFRPSLLTKLSVGKNSMLGIKKHVLELRNSLVVLGEAIGLKKGPKAPKKRPKASKRGRRPPKALRRS